MLKGPRPLNEFAAEVRAGGLFATQLKTALHRHMALDWKDMDEEDQAANLCAAMEGGARVLGAYRCRVTPEQDPDLWIITEADRSVTTFLLPEEY